MRMRCTACICAVRRKCNRKDVPVHTPARAHTHTHTYTQCTQANVHPRFAHHHLATAAFLSSPTVLLTILRRHSGAVRTRVRVRDVAQASYRVVLARCAAESAACCCLPRCGVDPGGTCMRTRRLLAFSLERCCAGTGLGAPPCTPRFGRSPRACLQNGMRPPSAGAPHARCGLKRSIIN